MLHKTLEGFLDNLSMIADNFRLTNMSGQLHIKNAVPEQTTYIHMHAIPLALGRELHLQSHIKRRLQAA